MALVLATAPTTEPMTVAELKTHLRIDHTNDDVYLAVVLKSATQYYEKHTNRTLVSTTWDLWMDGFDDPFYARNGVISLPRPPLSSVTYVKYYDASNVLQTWGTAEYSVDTFSEPGRVCTAFGYTYPQTYDRTGSVNIRFIAGEGAYTAVQENHKQAVRFLSGHLYENRESSGSGTEVKNVPMAYDAFSILDQVWVF